MMRFREKNNLTLKRLTNTKSTLKTLIKLEKDGPVDLLLDNQSLHDNARRTFILNRRDVFRIIKFVCPFLILYCSRVYFRISKSQIYNRSIRENIMFSLFSRRGCHGVRPFRRLKFGARQQQKKRFIPSFSFRFYFLQVNQVYNKKQYFCATRINCVL